MIDKSKINKDRVRLFVEELRSGKFPQTIGALQRVKLSGGHEIGFCCLGVACEVAIANGLPLFKGDPDDQNFQTDSGRAIVMYGDRTGGLPTEVYEWFGFKDDNPVLLIEDPAWAHRTIGSAQANDVLNWDFNKIADAFEKTYLQD